MFILEGHRNLPFLFSAVVGHRVFTTKTIFFSKSKIQGMIIDCSKITVLFLFAVLGCQGLLPKLPKLELSWSSQDANSDFKKSHLQNHLLNSLTLYQQCGKCSFNEEFMLTNIQISLQISYTLFYCYM